MLLTIAAVVAGIVTLNVVGVFEGLGSPTPGKARIMASALILLGVAATFWILTESFRICF